MKIFFLLPLVLLSGCNANRDPESGSMDTVVVVNEVIPDTSVVAANDTTSARALDWQIESPDSMKELYGKVQAYKNVEVAMIQKSTSSVDTAEFRKLVLEKAQISPEAFKRYAKEIKQETQQGMPRKLDYVQLSRPLFVGDEIPIQVLLQDGRNQLMRGQKAFAIEVNIKGMDNSFSRSDSLTIPAGESMGGIVVRLSEPGIYQVTCSNIEMQPAEWFLKVLPPEKKKMNYIDRSGASPFRLAGTQPKKAVLVGFVQTQKRVRANGDDRATITYFLQDPDNVLGDGDSVKVLLSTNEARLDQLDFYVSEEKEKRVNLTAVSPGIIRVSAQCLNPAVEMANEFYEVRFYAPIDRYQLKASPTIINLLEKSNIAVQLLNAAGEPIGTDEEMEASFYIESKSGSGLLEPTFVKIFTGKFEGSVVFLPTGTGELSLQGYVKTLPIQPPVPLKIIWPLQVTVLSIVGGLLGALLSHLVNRKKKLIITLTIGAVTGFVFFWMALYLGTAKLSHAIVLNQISVVVFGIAGGWLGADVMKLLLKRMNIEL